KSGDDFNLSEFYRISVIEVSNDFMEAQFRLCFEENCLKGLTKAMTGDRDEPNQEATDGTALELMNLIYGGAKSRLNDEKFFNLPSAIPSLLKKEQVMALRPSTAQRRLVIPFSTNYGSFYLDIQFNE